MLPVNKPFTFLSLQCAVSHLSFRKRMQLCAISKQARLIRKKKEDTLKYVKLHHVLNKKERFMMMYKNKSRVFEGTLSVEGIKWKFSYDNTTRKVTIVCSLKPEKSKVVDDREVIRKYFLHFMSNPVKHLKLKSCVDPFRGMITEMRCPKLTWNLNMMRRSVTFEGIQGHVFDKITFLNFGLVPNILEEGPSLKTKQLVVKTKLFHEGYQMCEQFLMFFLGGIKENLCQVTLEECVPDTFIRLCDIHFRKEYLVGSYSTTVLDNSAITSDYIWQFLRSRGFTEKLSFNNKECIILKTSVSGNPTVVIRNYENDNDDFQTFTVIKLAADELNRIRSSD